ncbi:MAG: hypothetical protein WD651_07990 [Acidimicrobiia bacterium]
MSEIPESLLRRSAEAKAKALGIPVEQVLAEMRGEAPATSSPEPMVGPEPTPASGELDVAGGESEAEPQEAAVAVATAEVDTESPAVEEEATEPEAPAPAPPTPVPVGNGSGNGKQAAVVSPRPLTPPSGVPEGVRTQRLLTVVKARAIQQVKTEPTDKVNTWPHLMIAEFTALMAITALLLVMSVALQAPLLDPANPNATPNPSKAPWYFLGLQELLSYFDPQIAGVTVPTIVGFVGFILVPFVDRNPSTRPSDRKFAIMLFTFFMAGAATLTIFGVLFRGRGFNFAYPWQDGIFFDDIKDWVFFE